MSNKKDYLNKCFSPNWLEVDLETVQSQRKEVVESSQADYEPAYINERKELFSCSPFSYSSISSTI